MRRNEHSVSRFHRRQWQRRLRSLRPLIITLAVVGALSFAAWVAYFSSWLAADRVQVQGETTLTDHAIVTTAAVDLGSPMAGLDLDEVSDRVAEMPAVAEVEVRRTWPDTVSISVVEREPVAAIPRGGAWWVMDTEGVVFRKTGQRVKSLPVVEIGRGADPEALREVASVVTALPDNLLDKVRRLSARSMDSIRLMLEDGRQVMWGSSSDSDRKAEVLKVLLERKAEVYDVSVPSRPTTTTR